MNCAARTPYSPTLLTAGARRHTSTLVRPLPNVGMPTRQLSAPVNAADVALTLDAQGYVMNLQVSEISFSAEEAALALGIPSLWFRLEDYADTIRVIAKGIGHGYGMSQYGADRYAGEGRDYKWILQHYFQGCEVKDSSSR